MRPGKRFLAFLMALTMSMSLLPTTVFATGSSSDTSVTESTSTVKTGLVQDDDGKIRYYVDGAATYAGLVQDADGNYYYINSSKKAVTNCTYSIGAAKTNGLLPSGTYQFGPDGKMLNPPGSDSNTETEDPEDSVAPAVKNGLVTDADGYIRYYENGVAVYKGLVQDADGNYYYINSTKKAVKDCSYSISSARANGLLPSGTYQFGPDGKMLNAPTVEPEEPSDPETPAVKQGLVTDEDGKIRYYENGVAVYKGLVQDADGNYYYINSTKTAVKDCSYGISTAKTNGLLPAGTYQFGPDGKMVIEQPEEPAPEEPETPVDPNAKNGLMKDADGNLRYYENGVAVYKGLVQDADGSYYYINSAKKAVKNCSYSISEKRTNDLLPAGTYQFGPDGKMIDPPVVEPEQPPVEDPVVPPTVENEDTVKLTTSVENENGAVKNEVSLSGEDTQVKATVPAGTTLTEGADSLTLSVTPLENTDSNITVEDQETATSYDVHMTGVSKDNTAPILVALGPILPIGLNWGNVALYHVEGDVSNDMTRVETLAELDAHNEFYYDPATGEVTVALATFSEIAVVNEESKWEGNYDYTWYDADVKELTIASADQLAGFGAIVGGMAEGIEQDSFFGKTVKLIADVNLGDKESENNPNLIFYPIGYNSDDGKYEKTGVAVSTGFYAFQGTFDGNGHTIKNFYQNTWEMKGDHNWYDATLQYYRDGMGLFGKVYGGTVKNLTVDNFSSDGEIATTGVIASYADGATFENIAITHCNPRVYNIGNGGIVGCVGWYAKEADLKTTFKNITVDQSNMISALWGSYDVACGGIVGQYYPTSGQTSSGTPKNAGIDLVNCHVSAQMDVYNDVCGNYQYYAYRYAGMIIGSIRENTTNEDGKTIPDMTGITATGCTVNYGDWNDYYYCEFEKNGHPSYSGPDDYKFSRVPHSELNFTDSNGNGVVDANERASVTGCKHNHTPAENNKAIYLPFHQLFTGYGWGVNSIGLEKYSGIVTKLDITEGDQEESVEKFKGNVTELSNNKTYSLSDIFTLTNHDVNLVPSALTVAVTNLDENNPVSATIVYDKENWENGTITLTGTGKVQITIQDYYFCTPTTITVEVTDREAVKKFETKFTGDFLYRVGNQNAVKLDSLFTTADGIEPSNIGTVAVTIENVAGDASGAYTANTTWTNDTIQFSGTGVVKVTITDNDYCIPTELYLEVVDATNYASSSISSLGSGNVALLCDTKLNKNGALALQNASLYGNGYELDVSAGRYTGESITANYLLYLNNGTLDNVRIVGAVYTEYGAVSSADYNNPTVLAIGNSTITNSYISNCASPVRVRSGNLTIENSTLKGGNFANLDIRGGVITLKDVTTVNQIGLNDLSTDGKEVVGLGIVVYYEGPSDQTMLIIEGSLKQYNVISSDTQFENEYAKVFTEEMFKTTYSKYQAKSESGNATYVNTGIISMYEAVGKDNIIANLENYSGQDVTFIAGLKEATGYLYSTLNAKSPDEQYSYSSQAQYEIVPKVSFDHAVNAVTKQDGSETSCTHDPLTDAETITFSDGDSFEWDVNILKSSNKDINFTVWMDGTQYADKIVFEEDGNYEIVFKYSDANNYRMNANGEVEQYTVEYETSMDITVNEMEASAKNAEITFPLLDSYGTTKVTVDGKTYIMPNLTGTNIPKYGDDLTFDASTRKYGSLKADGRSTVDIYYPIIKTAISGNYMVFPVFGNKNGTLVQIQDYADKGTGAVLTPYNASTQTLPEGLSVSRGYTVQWSTDKDVVGSGSMSYGNWTSGLLAFKYQSSSDDIACKVMSNYLSYYPNINLRSNDRNEQVMVAEYKYVDNKGDTFYYCVGYHIEERNDGYAFGETVPEDSGGGCVTGDSLVTLADGSKKRVDALTGSENLLVWNLETGALDTAPILFVDSDPEADVEIVHLYFSDGTDVKVIYEHGFWDYDLNRYVYLDANADKYIGHTFAKQDGDTLTQVQLTNVVLEAETTMAYSPVTAGHLCYFVNGMLSMPGGVGGLFNIFDVDPETMTYDFEAMERDIETYGLFTYEELNAIEPLSEEMFYQAGGPYLKVSIGKGNLTMDELTYMIQRYSKFFE